MSFFPASRQIKGDDPRIERGRGKPLPDIYLLALATINADLHNEGKKLIKPAECLVLEDAVSGVEAARRAGMQVVWCPYPEILKEYKDREDEVLAGLTGEHNDKKKPEVCKVMSLQTEGVARNGKPGKLCDGWGLLLHSLEDFPYQRYKISIPSS
jgi:pseudouridine 5'-phosphatase